MLLEVFITCIKLSKSSAFLGKNLWQCFPCSLVSLSVLPILYVFGHFNVLSNDFLKFPDLLAWSCCSSYSHFSCWVSCFSLFQCVFPELVCFICLFKEPAQVLIPLMYCLSILWFLFLFLLISFFLPSHFTFFLCNCYGFSSLHMSLRFIGIVL